LSNLLTKFFINIPSPSVWNVTDSSRGLVTRFTGWADIPLTTRGVLQASAAGRCLKMFGIKPDAVFTSLLRRSKDTLEEIKKVDTGKHYEFASVINSWRLNERHYGALVGLSKDEAERSMGKDNVMEWRRSWDQAPPKMARHDKLDWQSAAHAQPQTIISEHGKRQITATEKGINLPETESLLDCANRVQPLWKNGIFPRIMNGETVLIVAHANSIRTMIMHIDAETMTTETVRDVHIPSAVPLVYDFIQNENDRSIRPMGNPTKLGMRGRYLASRELMKLNLDYTETAADDVHGINENELDTENSADNFYDLIESGLKDAIDYADTGNGIKEALLITDGKGIILHSNKAWEALCGFTNDDIKGLNNGFLQGPLSDKKAINELNDKVQTGLPASASIINYRKSGAAFINNFTIVPIYNWLHGKNGKITASTGSRTYSGDGSSQNNVLVPDHFVARLDITLDQGDMTPLTPEELINRKLNKEKMKGEDLHSIIK
jgi:2,3-bisphosphoglycerate-dependent phosphoglycerate mutase